MTALSGLLMLSLAAFPLAAQDTARRQGKLMVTSGGRAAEALFRQLIGGPEPNVVFIPTGASSLRSDSGVIWNPDKQEHRAKYEQDILQRFGLKRVTLLHTRDRQVADTDAFVAPLRTADAVSISGGNAGRLADAYLGVKVATEVKALVDRGGV